MARFLSLSAAVFALLIAGFLPTAAQAEGGDMATCVVKDNGTVWCWGWISGETMPTSTPVQISGISDAKSVSGPSATHCALRKTGAVACWGSNYNGQLGNGTNSFSSSPVEVSGLSDAIALDTSDGSSCAVRVTGAVVCWGENSNGELGDGSTTNSNVPVSVVDLSGADDSSRALAVSVSESHACALMLAGSVKCWGSNSSGQLGDGTTDNSPTPVSVSALGDVTQIEAGVEGTCALRGDATVSCWGTNMIGLLGDGSSDPGSNLPVQVSGISTAVSISAPGYQRCAVLADGSLKCWGAIDLALAMTGDMSGAAFTPVPIAGITDAAYVLDGFYATCVVRLNGKAACLGLGVFGALGNGRPTLQAGPELPVQGLTDATDVQLGELFSCALRANKQINCWGVGPFGPDATSYMHQTSVPASVPDANDVESFGVGGSHGCAVITGGSVKCLGDGDDGRLGNGSDGDSFLAAVNVDGITDAAAVAAGRQHSCALLTGGTVKCWGDNWSGQLGDGTNDASSTPKAVSGLTDVSAVAAGGDTTCAIEDGGVWCWGELNDSNNTRSNEPEAVAGISTATKVAVGRSHACAVLADETAVCWGRNSGGKLGDGTAVDSATPVAVDGVTGVASIDAGESETCAVLNSGGVDCWGELTQRAHGGGETPAIYPVPGVSSATNVSVGAMATCARLADSTATCWGADYYGIAVFGDGEGPVGHGPQPTPHDVVGLTGVWTGHGNTDDDQPEDEDEGSDDDAVVDETPPVKTTPVDPPTILPPVKPIASVRFIGRKVIFTNYPVAATSKKKCPASVRVSVAVGKSLKKLKVLRVRRVAGACQVTGTVTLSSKVAKPRTLKIRLSGKSVRTRTVRVAKTVS